MKTEYFFEICDLEADVPIKRLGPYVSEHLRDKAVSGAERNMNHDEYYVRRLEIVTP